MCILKVSSKTYSFQHFADATQVPVCSVREKGEFRSSKETEKYAEFGISLVVSDADWDAFPDQVIDAIEFLEMHFVELKKLVEDSEVEHAFLDFPIYSRLNDDIINQNDHLPRKLVSLAGKLNLGIEMSIYSEAAFDDIGI